MDLTNALSTQMEYAQLKGKKQNVTTKNILVIRLRTKGTILFKILQLVKQETLLQHYSMSCKEILQME